MALSFLIFILLSFSNACDAETKYTNRIFTRNGPYIGTYTSFNEKSLQQFLGIPYAKPPVGPLRFAVPEYVIPHIGNVIADKLPPACIQYNEYPYPWKDNEEGQSEDCLYLNLWGPAGFRAIPYETIVWIHGGGFSLGSSRMDDYQGQALAALGNVIVITFNYRLGPFGFFTTQTWHEPENVALFDMKAALEWVNFNIHHFGGSKSRITLAGQGSGAVAVGLLNISPITRDLFQKIIMQSGSPAYLLAENDEDAILKSSNLAWKKGCATLDENIYLNSTDVVNCLRRMDPDAIAKAVYEIHNTSDQYFLPSYGKYMLPKNPRRELIDGNFKPVPVFFGSNDDEGAILLTALHPELFGIHGELRPQVNKTYGRILMKEIFKNSKDPDKIVNYYLREKLNEYNYIGVRYALSTALGDYNTVCPMHYFAEAFTKAGQDVYSYTFIHRPDKTVWARWMKAVQYQEVPFLFGVPLRREAEYDMYQAQLSKDMIKIWTSFAKTGKPYAYSEWPKYTKEDKRAIAVDTKMNLRVTDGIGPHKKNCEMWRAEFGFV